MRRTQLSAVDRFMSHVSPEPNSGCWLWTASGGSGGYGSFSIGRARANLMAHRVSYEMFRGPIPEGLHIDHLCRVRCCVNPAHLEPVTPRENVNRGIGGAGKPKTYGMRQKLSLSNKGKRPSIACIASVSRANRTRVVSESTRAKLRAAALKGNAVRWRLA